ncbi:thiol-disulfide oxidoreductase ResA [Paenibacillus sp. GYB004]|uniref:thiol-disulfide oxidoreductase ResA n=1 Tax=Paenibacillus sp. GYB004 TaxID=2994393 RepID=UPI002F9654F0
MKNNRKLFQILIFSVALLIGGFTIGNALINSEDPVKVGYKAPDFTLTGLDGKKYQLSDYQGKAVVLNFWGTFCPPCVREMPALQNQYDYWKAKDVEVLGINLNESRITVQSFVRQVEVTFPILLDNDTVRKMYQIKSYPSTIYIDPNGKISDIMVGEMTEEDIDSRIRNMLKSP